jgi:hypothetical protein
MNRLGIAVSVLVGVVLAVGSLPSVGTAQGQKRQPLPVEGDGISLDKRLAAVEGRLVSLLKELQELRRELRTRPEVTAVSVNQIEATEVVHVIREIYQSSSGVMIEALPKLSCVAFRADSKTTREIRELIDRLEEAAPHSGEDKGRVITIPPARPDPALLKKVLDRLQEQKSGALK